MVTVGNKGSWVQIPPSRPAQGAYSIDEYAPLGTRRGPGPRQMSVPSTEERPNVTMDIPWAIAELETFIALCREHRDMTFGNSKTDEIRRGAIRDDITGRMLLV